MRFEIKVEDKGGFQKLLLLNHLHRVFGITILDARKIVDEIEKLHAIGGSHVSVIIDSEEITMSPIFKTERPNPVFTYKDLGLEINVIKEAEKTNLDLCELLKDCIDMEFYMPHYGVSKLIYIDFDWQKGRYLRFQLVGGEITVSSNGKYVDDAEICVFPSKDQRDWSLFVPPWIPQKGERVWVRKNGSPMWVGKYFVKMDNKEFACGVCQSKGEDSIDFWDECVPFEQIPW